MVEKRKNGKRKERKKDWYPLYLLYDKLWRNSDNEAFELLDPKMAGTLFLE